MKFLVFFLTLFVFQANSTSIIVLPPEGQTPMLEFESSSHLEQKAYLATIKYLNESGETASEFYIIKHKLDVKTGLYNFFITHSTSFTYRNVANSPDGVIYYDFKLDKVIKYELLRKTF